MIRILSLPAILLFACFCCPWNAVVADEPGQSGLLIMWQSQVMIDGARDKIAEIHLHVHDDRADSYYEIRFPGFRETVSFDDLNPRGVAFRDVYSDNPGQGALEWAELKKEILEAEGKKDVSIELITVPRTTLFALTGSGGIHAIDAETGQTRWKTRVGLADEPTIGLAANNTRVIVVRGSRVYCLNALTGGEIWSHYAEYAPGGGVSISDYFAYVTSINGRLQMFPLNGTGMPQAFFASSGAATFDPAVTPRTVSWATERGYFNVARSNVVSLRYRLETNDEFHSPGAAVGDMLIANSTDGKVYALAEEVGSLAWEFAIGERLVKKPIVIGSDTVMFITANNNLVALNARKGTILEGWPKRITGVADYVGGSQSILYFIDTRGELVGLSRATGATVSLTSIGLDSFAVPNQVTDRLYLADAGGAIVCLRELANINPVVMGDNFKVGNAAAEAEQTESPDSGESKDPFARPDNDQMQQTDPGDPLGAGKADPADPFAGGAADPDDPFAGDKTGDDKSDDKSGDKSGDDPFGGGDKSDDKSGDDDDPFGNR